VRNGCRAQIPEQPPLDYNPKQSDGYFVLCFVEHLWSLHENWDLTPIASRFNFFYAACVTQLVEYFLPRF